MNAVGPRVGTDERRAFTRFKCEFYDRMIRSKELTVLDLRVSWLLSSTFLNWETGTAWPAARTMAEILCVREESVRRSIKRLTKIGWWRIVEQGRRGRSNEYAPNWDGPQLRQDLTAEDPDRPVREGHSDATDTLTDGSDLRTGGSEDPDRRVTPTLLGNPEKEPKEATVHSNGTAEPRTADDTKMIARQEDDSDSMALVDRDLPNDSEKGETVGPATKRRQQNSNKGVSAHKARSSVPRETASEARAIETWSTASDAIKSEITEGKWDAWLKSALPISDDGKTFVLALMTGTMVKHVQENFSEVIARHTNREVELIERDPVVIETSKRLAKIKREAASSSDTTAQPAGPRKSGTHD